MHPSSSRALQRDQEHDMKHPSSDGSHKYKTKQNKQTTLLRRQISTQISFFWVKNLLFCITKLGEEKSAKQLKKFHSVYLSLKIPLLEKRRDLTPIH